MWASKAADEKAGAEAYAATIEVLNAQIKGSRVRQQEALNTTLVGIKGQTKQMWADKTAEETASVTQFVARMDILNAQIKSARLKQQEALESRAYAQVKAATFNPVGSFSTVSSGALNSVRNSDLDMNMPSKAMFLAAQAQKELNEHVEKGVAPTKRLTAAHANLSAEMRDMHSAARGLASGFGAMWLTWGNILPLLAGASVSNAASQAIKVGAEVGQSLATMQFLAGDSTQEIAKLNAELLKTAASGPFGPAEVAKALETLALAGLDAKDQLAALKPTLDFAVAGNMPIEKAAESLVAISTAFGYAAKDMSVVSDLVAKSAAISMSTVEGMSSSFKIASVVAQHYKVSLLDVSAGLSMLANVGIKNQAAGTAIKEMYNDLIGKSGEARKLMQDVLKFSAFTPDGKSFKPLTQSIQELSEAFLKLRPDAQFQALQTLAGERGAKGFATFFAAVRDETKRTGESASELSNRMKEVYRQLDEAPGFSALAALGMAGSTMNQLKETSSTLQAALVEAFQAVEPAVLRVTNALQTLFKSAEFKSAIQSMVSAVAGLVRAVLDNIDPIVTLGKAYLVYAAASASAAVVTAVMGSRFAVAAAEVVAAGLGMAGFTVATQAATVATGQVAIGSALAATGVAGMGVAARAAVTPMMVLQAAAGWIGAIAVAATAAYTAYQLFASSSSSTSKELDKSLSDKATLANQTVTSLDNEIDRLKGVIAAHGDEKKAIEDKANATRAAALENIGLMGLQQSAQLSMQRDAVVAEKSSWRANSSIVGKGYADAFLSAKNDEIAAIDSQIASVGKSTIRMYDTLSAKFAEVVALSKRARDLTGSGGTSGGNGTLPDKTSNRLTKLSADHSKEMELIKSRYSSEMTVISQAESGKQKLLAAQRSALMVSDGQFYAEELALARSTETQKLALIANSTAEATDAYKKQYDAYKTASAEYLAANNGKAKFGPEQIAQEAKRLEDQLEKLGNDYVATVAKMNDDGQNVENSALVRMQLQAIAAQGDINKLAKEAKDFWALEDQRAEKTVRQTALEDQLRYASPEARAWISATASEQERLNSLIQDHQNKVDLLQASADYYASVVGPRTTEEAALEAAVNKVLADRIKLRDDLKGRAPGLADAAGQRALDKQAKDTAAKLRADVSDAIVTGLLDGGEKGADQLRAIVVKKLREPVTLVVNAMVNAFADGVSGMVGGAASNAVGSAGGSMMSSLFGSGATSSSIGKDMASGASSTVAGWFGSSASSAGSMIATPSAAGGYGVNAVMSTPATVSGGTTSMATTVGSYMPYLLAFAAAVTMLKGGDTVQSKGYSDNTYDTLGVGTALGTRYDSYSEIVYGRDSQSLVTYPAGLSPVDYGGGFNPQNMFESSEAKAFVSGLANTYLDAAKTLGFTAESTHFGFSANDTGKGIVLGGTSDGSLFNSGEIDLKDNAATKLAASRAVLSAIQSSDLPAYLSKVFVDILPKDATQEAMDAAIGFGSALKTTRDALTETRTPLQVLQSAVDTSFAEMGTNAADWKKDFVAAIDAGLTPAEFAKWKTLEKNVTDLGEAAGTAARSVEDIASNIKGLTKTGEQLVIDLLALTDPAGAQVKQKALDTTGYTAAEIKLYDDNADTRAKIATAKTLAGWTDKLASLAASASPVLQRAYDKQKDLIGITDKATIGKINDYYKQLDSNDIAAQTLSTKEKINILTGETTQTEIDRAKILKELDELDPSKALSKLTQSLWELEDAAANAATAAESLSIANKSYVAMGVKTTFQVAQETAQSAWSKFKSNTNVGGMTELQATNWLANPANSKSKDLGDVRDFVNASTEWRGVLAANTQALQQDAQKAAQDAETAASALAKTLNDKLALQAQIYELTGDSVAAATVLEKQRAISIADLNKQDPSGELGRLTTTLWGLQDAAKKTADAAKLTSDTLALQSQIYELTGDAAGAASVLEKQRALTLIDLNKQDASGNLAALTTTLWGLQDAAKKAADAAKLTNDKLSVQAQIYELTKDKVAAASVLEQQRLTTLAELNKQDASGELGRLTQTLWGLQDSTKSAAADLELQNTRQDWANRAAIASGTATEREIQLKKDLAATTDDMSKSLIAAAYAAEDLAASMKLQADWQDKLDVLQKRKADSQLSMASDLANVTDKTTRSLIRQYYAQLDVNDAAEKATALETARTSVASAFKAILDAAENAAKAETEARKNITTGYVNAQKAVADAQKNVSSVAQQAAQKMRDFATNIKDFLIQMGTTDLGGQNKAGQYANLQADFAIAAAQARAGDVKALGEITNKASALLTAGRDQSVTAEEYSLLAANVGNTLSDIATLANGRTGPLAEAVDPMVEAQQKLVEAQADLTKWTEAINVSGAATALATTDYLAEWRLAQEASVKAQADLTAAQTMTAGIDLQLVSVLGNLSNLITTYQSALTAYGAASDKVASNPVTQITKAYQDSLGRAPDAGGMTYWETQAASGTSMDKIAGSIATSAEAKVRSLYTSMLGREADTDGMDYWIGRLNTGSTLAQIAAEIEGSDEYKGLPKLAVGTNWVPQDMDARLHKGEAVVPAAFNPERYSIASGNDALVEEIRALRQDNANIRAELQAIAINTGKVARIQKVWDGDGMPATRTL
jgi:hypothetical protein